MMKPYKVPASSRIIWSKVLLYSTLSLLLLSFSIRLTGQSAPQIVVTDTDGNAHDLYQDYIDKGKSVMIGIFFSSCTPCQLIAEDLEALYQDWGFGEYDVEFIEISTQEWETDLTAENYRELLNLTFPVVSAEGGSLAAVDSLVNGGFGPFYGAPLYLVVGPDSSVQWNLFGFGNEGTIQAIDEALVATGASKPTTAIPHEPHAWSYQILPNRLARGQMGHIRASTPLDRWTYRVVSVFGELIISGTSEDPSFETTHLPSGMYFLSVLSGNRHLQTMPFVVI